MKKAYKILLAAGGFVLIVVIVLYLFRHQIASYALRTVIHNRSDGNVTLTIKSTYFSVSKGTVKLTGPDIYFEDAYLDENRTIKLNRISLDEILIDSISILDVMSKRHIIAGNLIIKKPVIWFEEREGEEKSSFNPDKLMQTLNQEPSDMSKLNISIRTIEIQYGSLNIAEETNDIHSPGYVDFKLILHNFSTQPPSDTSIKKILFSDDFLFKIKNLQKLFPSGYQLSIDSAWFSSLYKSMIWNGVSVSVPQQGSKPRQGIDLHAKSFKLNDIEIKQLKSLSDLHLRSLIISNGYLYNYGDRFIKQGQNDSVNDKGARELFSILHGLSLDTIWLDQFDYARVLDNLDTTFLADDISMMVNGLSIDSTMLADPWKKLTPNEISFRTGRFYANELIDSIDVKFSEVAFYSSDEKFLLDGLGIYDNRKVRGKKSLEISSGKIKIDDFSIVQFQQGLKQSIKLTILEPEIIVNADESKKKGDGKGPEVISQLFNIEYFVIKNGNFSFTNDSLSFNILGLNFTAENFEFSKNGKIPIEYDNVSLNLEKLNLSLKNRADLFSTGSLIYEGDYFRVDEFQTILRTGKKTEKSSLKIGSVQFNGFALDKFLKNNELKIKKALIENPVIEGRIQLLSKTDSSHTGKAMKAWLPFKTDIRELVITGGGADCKILSREDSIYIKTLFHVQLSNMEGDANDTANLWFEKLDWKIQFAKANVAFGRNYLKFSNLVLDEINSKIKLQDFKFNHDKQNRKKDEPFEITSLILPKCEINDVDIKRFVFHDTLVFQKILIDKPSIKAIVHPVIKVRESKASKPSFAFMGKINYDTIDLKNLNFEVEHRGNDSSNAYYQLKDLSIHHLNNTGKSGNFFSELEFTFDNFMYSDTIKNFYVNVSKGQIDPLNQTVSISRVWSGQLLNSANSTNSNNNNYYNLTNIQLSGIYLEDKLPTQFTVEKLRVDSLDLFYTRKSEVTTTNAIDINRNLLSNYNHIISKFKIDTTLLNNIQVNYFGNGSETEGSINFSNVALVLNKFSLDTVTTDGNSFPLNNVTINLRGRTFVTKDSLYNFKTGNVNYNFALNKLKVDSVWFTPRYSDDTVFFNKAVYQTDRMNIFAEQVEFSDIRFKEYIDNKIIHVGGVDFHHITADMARDKSYPMKPGLFKAMPQASLRNASQVFTIDSLRVFDSYIKYTQRVEKSDVPGQIYFDRFNIQMYNISNDPRFVDSSSQLTVNANGYIMGQSRLDLSVYFDLLSPVDKFWFKAKSQPIDMTCLNSMTENLMGMSIQKGNGYIEIPRIEGDSGIAQGSLIFMYKKLKVMLYNRKKAQMQKGMFAPLVDFMLNDLLLKSNNPKFARSPRVGVAYFERDTEKAIVNYVFKSALSGILSTLGFNNKDQRQEKKEMKDDEINPENNQE